MTNAVAPLLHDGLGLDYAVLTSDRTRCYCSDPAYGKVCAWRAFRAPLVVLPCRFFCGTAGIRVDLCTVAMAARRKVRVP